LIEAADQQRQTQGTSRLIAPGLAPVEAARSKLGENRLVLSGIRRNDLAKNPGEDILGHPGSQPLGIGVGQHGKLIGGNMGSSRHVGSAGRKWRF